MSFVQAERITATVTVLSTRNANLKNNVAGKPPPLIFSTQVKTSVVNGRMNWTTWKLKIQSANAAIYCMMT